MLQAKEEWCDIAMSYKSVKNRLIKRYGKECFIEKLHLRQPEDKPQKYKSHGQFKRMKQLTYHHIVPKSEGGKATIDNRSCIITRKSRLVP